MNAWKRFLLALMMAVIPSSLFGNTVYFPQVVFGDGYSTTFVIVNAGTSSITSGLRFSYQSGLAGQIQAVAAKVSSGATIALAALQGVGLPASAARAQAIVNQANDAISRVAALQAQLTATQVVIASSGPTTATTQQLQMIN